MALGYKDTPLIPGTQFHVHDPDRAQPVIVTPGTESSQAAAGLAPSDAISLFNGKNLDGWVSASEGDAKWKVENGCLAVVPKTGDIKTTKKFGDCQLHLEWMAPSVVRGESQGRGNSGVFIMGRYEVQVLDGYDNPTYADGTTGAIYGQTPPLANACRKPGTWQVYDIAWEAPRFADGKLEREAYVTIFLNGVLIQNHTKVQGPTLHRETTSYKKEHGVGSLRLQDHGDLVQFRNIWYREIS